MRERAESPVAPTSVLYVDSDADFAQLVDRSLTRLDPTVSVRHVESADAAFDAIGDSDDPAFDCVVSAYTLARRDAVSFLESFRVEFPDLPFVLFTGAGSESVAADAIAAGVSAYVPVRAGENNFELLAQRIWSVTQGYRAKRRAEATAAELRRAYQRTAEAVVAIDPDDRVVFANDRFGDYYDVDRDRIAGEHLWRVVPSLAGTDVESACRRVGETRGPETVRTEAPDGVPSRVRVFPDEDGGVICYVDRPGDEVTLERRDCLAAVVDGVGTPALIADGDCEVVFANEAATRRLGVTADPGDDSGPGVGAVVAEPDADRVASAVQTVVGRARGDGGVRGHDGPSRPTDGGTTGSRVVETVGLPGTDTTADLRVEPVTVVTDPHALVVVAGVDESTE